jgi:hypothetical protein
MTGKEVSIVIIGAQDINLSFTALVGRYSVTAFTLSPLLLYHRLDLYNLMHLRESKQSR